MKKSRMKEKVRPSNSPGGELEKRTALCKPRGRKAKTGPCAVCKTEGRLIRGQCRACYQHGRYLARPEVAERMGKCAARRVAEEIKEKEKSETRVKRIAEKKEKQLRSARWKAAHPARENKRERSEKESPSWVADWLKQQVENYIRKNAGWFERRGTSFWVMTEDQVIGLCRIIYVAQRHHNDKRGYQSNDNYARREGSRAVREGDGFYLDKPISAELKGLK